MSKLGRGEASQLGWSLCSQSPHDDAVVVRCAQWRPHQPPRWIRVKSRGNHLSDARSEGQSGDSLERGYKKIGQKPRWTRAGNRNLDRIFLYWLSFFLASVPCIAAVQFDR